MAVALALLLAVGLVLVEADTAVGSDTSTRWDNFSESSGCGEPFTATPFVSKQGGLGDAEPILGPFGTYFGRSIQQVRQNLTWWVVPGSGGESVRIHRAMLPALRQVAEGLAAEEAAGRVYAITSATGFVPRTIGGSYRLSRHGLGLAIDINPRQNPYRADNALITDMPQWFVDVWKQAGFCWGGDWLGKKDAMHFSWIGPAGGSGPLTPLPPRTEVAAFGGPVARHSTTFAPVVDRYRIGVVDGTGNGAPDVVGVRPGPDGSVIDIASSTGGYGECSVSRWFVPDPELSNADHVLFGDVDGDSRQDLIALSDFDGALSYTLATRRGWFEDLRSGPTGLGSDAVAVAAADFDGDGLTDLWETTPAGRLRVWQGPDWAAALLDEALPGGAPARIAAGDRDGDDKPELFALYPGVGGSSVQALKHQDGWLVEQSLALSEPVELIAALSAADYDGDGRADLEILGSGGDLSVRLGNTSTGVPASRWFLHPEYECDEDEVPLAFNGTFYDDDTSIFEINIESIAAASITLGCNPPFGDMFCPAEAVTRGEMAAFLVRALGLEVNTHHGFTDVGSDNIFVEDIGRLATAGITLGCTQSGDKFCPDQLITRGAMAAFMVRGLGLDESSHPGFIDVPEGSIFHEDISRLATAGITRGCTSSGDRFCPFGQVSREEMAAFLDRADLGAEE